MVVKVPAWVPWMMHGELLIQADVADAALGQVMDSAMDQGGAPGPGAQPAMDMTQLMLDIVDPGMGGRKDSR